MAGIALIVSGIISAGASLGMGIHANNKAKAEAARQERERKKRDAELRALEASRQDVIDVSDDIRALKDDVFNPYQNLSVAMQGVNLKMEETDEALANTLNALNQSGAGAGAATQLARQAAASKAQVAAAIENQELKNQQLYLQGEQQQQQQKMALEQAALQEEIGAFGRQEARDVMQMQRIAGLSDRAAQMGFDATFAGQQALTAGVAGAAQSLGTVASGIGELE
jgi:hypothetical protein|tara:strand:+ start:573 stop:1250 length:678 start_codon:yes stop_codon:yes gene_type:complete